MKSRNIAWGAGIAAAAFVITAWSAAAVGTIGADGLYTACYDAKGVVRLVTNDTTTCPKGYTGPVTWNAVGQPGTAGQPGAAGASAYEVAVSNGFTGTQTQWLTSLQASSTLYTKSGVFKYLVSGGSEVVVLSTTLPAGSYQMTAFARVNVTTTVPDAKADVYCSPLGTSLMVPNGTSTFTHTWQVTVSEPTPFQIRCGWASTPPSTVTDAVFYDTQLSALKVGEIVTLP